MTVYDASDADVYVVRCGDRIKIGMSQRPHFRAKQLGQQTKQSTEILVILRTEDPYEYERALHQKFAEFRIEGEWFHDVAPIRSWCYTQVREGRSRAFDAP